MIDKYVLAKIIFYPKNEQFKRYAKYETRKMLIFSFYTFTEIISCLKNSKKKTIWKPPGYENESTSMGRLPLLFGLKFNDSHWFCLLELCN